MPNVIDGNAGGLAGKYIYGTGESDVFTFSEDHGDRDHIYGFNARQGDVIDLTGFEQDITWDELKQCITATQDPIKGGWCLQIDLSQWGGGYIMLHGLSESGYYLGDAGQWNATKSLFKLPEQQSAVPDAPPSILVVEANEDADYTLDGYDDGALTIDLSAFEDIDEFSDISASQDGDNVVIDLSAYGGGSVTLVNWDLDDLDVNDFILADDADGM